MIKCIAVFKSRTQALSFIDDMKRRRIPVKLISTPKEAHIGCGNSVEIPLNAKNSAMEFIRIGNYSSFYGFFHIEKVGSRTTTVRF